MSGCGHFSIATCGRGSVAARGDRRARSSSLSQKGREHARPTTFPQDRLFPRGRGPRRRRALTGARRTLAEEAPPETTSLRLGQEPPRLASRRLTSSTISCATRASPTSATCQSAGCGLRGRSCAERRTSARTFPHRDIIGSTPAYPVMLAGVHPACFELFARESIRSVVDLKGKNVGVSGSRGRRLFYAQASSPPASASIPPRTSTGSPSERAIRRSFSATTRSTHS